MTRLVRILLLVAAMSAGLVPTANADTGGASPEAASTGGAPFAADGQVALVSRTDHLLGRLVRLDGRAGGRAEGTAITIERFEPFLDAWVAVASATTGPEGVFAARWRADHIGVFRFRAVATAHEGQARAAAASPDIALTVYRPAVATWYGPGFYGRRTACGQRMSKRLLGVAHKKLACGTQVALFHKGRTITVPVVDRGPFRKHTDWDLTSATAEALGFTATGTIGAVRLRTSVAR
jgi:hypothetical protein